MIEDIQIVIIAGFMDAGKTTYIKQQLKNSEERILVIQFEDGEEEFTEDNENLLLEFDREDITDLAEVIKKIDFEVRNNECDRILVEWNGMLDFQIAVDIFMSHTLKQYSHIENVTYLVDIATGLIMIGQTGVEPITQIMNTDYVLITKNEEKKDINKVRQVKQAFRSMNPDAKVFTSKKKINRKIWKKKALPIYCFLAALIVVGWYIFLAPYIEILGFHFNQWMIVLTAILLEGIPFLLIGTFISAIIQVLIPDGYLEKIYPKKPFWGILTAVIAGFFVPVCDCAIVPVAKGLIKKGVPFGAAVTFMVVTPIVNPIVIVSTYFAFNGDLSIVGTRIGLGILCGIVIGMILSFDKIPVKMKRYNYDRICKNCMQSKDAVTIKQKIFAVLKQTEDEFYAVVKYLILGGGISATIQVFGKGVNSAAGVWPIPVLIIIFMIFAFLVSMCSTSDAVVAKSMLNQFSIVPIMAFVVFGPMMDVKNYLMLSNGFSKKTVLHIVIVISSVCFGVLFLFYIFGGVSLL